MYINLLCTFSFGLVLKITYIFLPTEPHITLLDWKSAQAKFPWNVTLLLGSGFAIAKACEASNPRLIRSYYGSMF